jgi:glycosyltransferase involved in cell wall biosynthesis
MVKMTDIYVDLTGLVDRKCTGIERYAKIFYESLVKKYPKKHIVFLTLGKNNDPKALSLGKNYGRIITEYFYLPLFLFCKKPELVMFPIFPPAGLCWLVKNKKTNIIPFIFDVVPWQFKHTMSLKAKLLLIPRFNACLKYAKHVITISKTEKDSLRKYTNADIDVIYPSVSDAVINKSSDIIEKLNLEKRKYLLTVSTIESRKNYEYLLDVLSIINLKKYNLTLVVVGRSGWGKRLRPIEQDKLPYITTGYISDTDLSVLYQNAMFYLTLPVHEGFGYTPVEALLNNTPVIVSDIPIFHEILQNGVFFIPLKNVDMASKFLEKIICLKYGIADYKRHYEKYHEKNAVNLIPDNFLEGVCNECSE